MGRSIATRASASRRHSRSCSNSASSPLMRSCATANATATFGGMVRGAASRNARNACRSSTAICNVPDSSRPAFSLPAATHLDTEDVRTPARAAACAALNNSMIDPLYHCTARVRFACNMHYCTVKRKPGVPSTQQVVFLQQFVLDDAEDGGRDPCPHPQHARKTRLSRRDWCPSHPTVASPRCGHPRRRFSQLTTSLSCVTLHVTLLHWRDEWQRHGSAWRHSVPGGAKLASALAVGAPARRGCGARTVGT